MPGAIIIPLFLILAVGMMLLGWMAEKQRRERMAAYCRERGLRYDPERDRSFDDRFGAFPGLRSGSNRFFRHRMTGRLEDCELVMGEFHYQVTSGSGKNRSTHHYYSTLVLVCPSFRLPDLSIRREGLFDRVKSAFGWDDIDFASAAFSDRYHVSAPDRDDAFAMIQPRTMELLLGVDGLEFHIRYGWLLVRKKGKLRLEELTPMQDLALAFLREIPDFVKEGAGR